MSDSDFSGRLPGPVTARPRRPLSNRASTASCSMRFSLLTMISGAPRSSRRLRRLVRLMTRRGRAVRAGGAKRPPSDRTNGRSPRRIAGDPVHHHQLRFVPRRVKRDDALQPLDRTGLLLAFARLHLVLELEALGLEVDLLQQVADRLRAHAAAEVLTEAVGRAEALLELTERGLVVLDLLGLHGLEELPDV